MVVEVTSVLGSAGAVATPHPAVARTMMALERAMTG
jgi:hypothetical protein